MYTKLVIDSIVLFFLSIFGYLFLGYINACIGYVLLCFNIDLSFTILQVLRNNSDDFDDYNKNNYYSGAYFKYKVIGYVFPILWIFYLIFYIINKTKIIKSFIKLIMNFLNKERNNSKKN